MRSRSLWKEPDSLKIRKYSANSTSSVRTHFDRKPYLKRASIDLRLNNDRETMENQSGLSKYNTNLVNPCFPKIRILF